MTDQNQQIQTPDIKLAPFGARLKSAREALGLDSKDAAAQLRLNEKVILMMEKERYPTDLPATFIRGYIRAYAKLLHIPEHEVKKAIEPIQQTISSETAPLLKPVVAVHGPVSSSNYFMQFFSYLILFILIGLAGTWWYMRNSNNQITPTLQSQENATTINNNSNASPIKPVIAIPEPAHTQTPSAGPMPASNAPATNAETPQNATQPLVGTPAKVPPANVTQDKIKASEQNTDDQKSTDATDDNNDTNTSDNNNNTEMNSENAD